MMLSHISISSDRAGMQFIQREFNEHAKKVASLVARGNVLHYLSHILCDSNGAIKFLFM